MCEETTKECIAPAFGIYVHIPFCARKCHYCDFTSAAVNEVRRKAYLAALEQEILATSWVGSRAETLYLGGGTPSELQTGELNRLVRALTDQFSLAEGSERSIECNPNSAGREFFQQLRWMGFNRISLGVQSFKDHHLTLLGRPHHAEHALQAYRWARETGFENISIDLIFSIPGQTLDEWAQDLEQAFRLEPEHLSLYGLTIEPHTEFGRRLRTGTLKDVDAEASADMFELAMEMTERAGYQQYEISNYSLPGYECQHNSLYWRNEPYLGFGLSAASYIDGTRWVNTAEWDEYEQSAWAHRAARAVEEKLPSGHALSEEVMLRLRTREGVSPRLLSIKYKLDFWELFSDLVEFFLEQGLLTCEGESFRLTHRGKLLANEVCAEFLRRGSSQTRTMTR